jgi:hypothetical protein
LTAALKQALACGEATSLERLVVANVSNRQSTDLYVRASIVLDLSGSSASSGERLFHPAALALALAGLLERHVHELNVFQVGGTVALNGGELPHPKGATDLATAIIEAARYEPDAMLVVTDGYENARQGDAAQVIAGLRRLGLRTAILQVAPVIAAAEDLSRRRLSELVPVVAVEHETGAGELAARMLLAAQPEELGTKALQAVGKLLFGDFSSAC